MSARPSRDLEPAKRAVTAFLDEHWQTARDLGWTDVELFGCHSDPTCAAVRYDYAGAVTMAALTGTPIVRVTERAAHCENGLTYYRRPMPDGAVPMWHSPVENRSDRAVGVKPQ